jgi:hypothetical protein
MVAQQPVKPLLTSGGAHLQRLSLLQLPIILAFRKTTLMTTAHSPGQSTNYSGPGDSIACFLSITALLITPYHGRGTYPTTTTISFVLTTHILEERLTVTLFSHDTSWLDTMYGAENFVQDQ